MLTPSQIENLQPGQQISYTDLLPYLVGETCTGSVVVCPITHKEGLEVHLERAAFNSFTVTEAKKLYQHE